MTAFAVDDPNLKDPYVPIMPEFLSGANVNIPLDKSSGTARLFFSDFYEKPYIIAVQQLTATKYYPSSGAENYKFVGDDKLWSLDFIKVSNYSGVGADIHFRFHHKNDYRVYPASCPIGLVFTDTKTTNPAYLEILSYQYDFKNKVFKAPVYQTHSSSQGLQYSYVLASSPVTQFPIPQYPQYGKLGNIPVTYSYDVNYPNVHYNWWLGNADITNDVKPDEPSKPDEP
ncbi:hypothetical protein, partial [Hydrogenoanaerobacterium saccharovorans]|uniref:hypothetical protein n=1 Tax=Hydrogenoanaerobacterium saccharovorans TaxID=474960 RepID=UPI0013BE9C33